VILRPAYRFAARLAHRVPLPAGTLHASVAGRRGAACRWADWVARHRAEGPLLWLHAASIGEVATAEPVIERLRTAVPALQVILTYSSPAVERWERPLADHRDFVPLDEPSDCRRVIASVAPTAMAFSRGDIWPELAWQAAAHNTPLAVFSATVRPTSLRLRAPLRSLYAPVLEPVSWLGAASQDDAARWISLGMRADRVTVTGDTRHDQVLERVVRPEVAAPLRPWATGGATLVAGSVESSDDAVVFEAALRVLTQRPEARLLIVPHDGSAAERDRLLRRAGRLPCTTWRPGDPTPEGPVVIVEGRGALFDLYPVGAAAYVGGGFRRGGLHAVVEPAALGLPVIVGPHWPGSQDAVALVRSKAGFPLPRRRAAEALARWWVRCVSDDHLCRTVGDVGSATLARGAASRTADRLAAMLVQ
jgi:3-deoxy-D-manno-octulosonic-acid transferase